MQDAHKGRRDNGYERVRNRKTNTREEDSTGRRERLDAVKRERRHESAVREEKRGWMDGGKKWVTEGW